LQQSQRLHLVETIVVVALVVFIGIYLYVSHRETLPDAAKRAHAAFVRRDTKTLLEMCGADESRALSLNQSNLGAFFKEFVDPRLSGFAPVGDPKIRLPFEESASTLASQRYVHPDGRQISLDLTLVDTPKGPKIESLVTSLYLSLLWTWNEPGPINIQHQKRTVWSKGSNEGLKYLDKQPLPGFYLLDSRYPKGKIVRWEEFAKSR